MRVWPFKPRGVEVHPDTHEIFKFMPHNPPEKGDHVLVNGVRHRVVYVDLEREGRAWTIKKLRVVPAPLDRAAA